MQREIFQVNLLFLSLQVCNQVLSGYSSALYTHTQKHFIMLILHLRISMRMCQLVRDGEYTGL